MRLVDTHCHLDFEPLLSQRHALLAQGLARGLTDIVVPAVKRALWPALRDMCAGSTHWWPAYGLHPVYLPEHRDEDLDALQAWLAAHPAIAVGECGLDWFVEDIADAAGRARQRVLFREQIRIARRAGLPMVLHVRRAHDDVLADLRRMKFDQGGIVHAFAGSADQAAHFRKLGFKLGFGGAMTWTRATRVRALARDLPLSDIVLETDAPDMAPADVPPEQHTPLSLFENFRVLCELRSEAPEQIAAATTANACAALRLPAA